jgi:hypothetical protein
MSGGYPFQPVDLSGSYIGDNAALVVGTVASGVAGADDDLQFPFDENDARVRLVEASGTAAVEVR